MSEEIAILMAAGLGSRMKPITNDIPKPLVEVRGVPLIETLIDAFEQKGISKIYIVTGYLKDRFYYLKEKYPNIVFIENKEYLEKNNISSLKAAGEVLGSADCYICEADLFLKDIQILERTYEQSVYFGKRIGKPIEDWGFQADKGRIRKIQKSWENTYKMAGISWWTKKDANRIKEAIEVFYRQSGHELLFWDEVVNSMLEDLHIKIEEIPENSVIEVDTLEELCEIDKKYRKYLIKEEEHL